jgi:hypothetical protein
MRSNQALVRPGRLQHPDPHTLLSDLHKLLSDLHKLLVEFVAGTRREPGCEHDSLLEDR